MTIELDQYDMPPPAIVVADYGGIDPWRTTDDGYRQVIYSRYRIVDGWWVFGPHREITVYATNQEVVEACCDAMNIRRGLRPK